MSQQAHYHQRGRSAVTLDVIATHDDGTVDLAREGQTVVAGCPLSVNAADGHATIIPSDSVPETKKLSKKK